VKDTTSQIQTYLEDVRKGKDRQNAFCALTTMSHDVLPGLIEAFKKEQDKQVRAFLVETIWQHRQQSVIPFLAEALHDPEPDVWKEALDGLVTLASTQAVEALRSAKQRQFKHDKDAQEFREWIDEAIEQAVTAMQRH
jgi:hypothetical protein